MAIPRTSIPPGKLRIGDILLYHGVGIFPRMIRLFDGSEYSHVSIFDGARVVEAVPPGIVAGEVAKSVAGAAYVHVYRFIDSKGVGLATPSWPVAPLLANIQTYVTRGDRYAYEQLLLLAVLAATRTATARLPLFTRRLIRDVLDEGAELLTRLSALGREPMICSELIFRCFAHAAPSYPVAIRGVNVAARTRTPRSQTAMYSDDPKLAASARVFLSQLNKETGRPGISAAAVKSSRRRGTTPVPDFVTPGDLIRSPNFHAVGTLKIATG